MIRHGQTGYLCQTGDELAYYTPGWPMTSSTGWPSPGRPRATLVSELADPQQIGAAWQLLIRPIMMRPAWGKAAPTSRTRSTWR